MLILYWKDITLKTFKHLRGPASHTDERVKLNLKCCQVNIVYNNQHHVTDGKEIE